ncbi:MAG: hypothetical protein JWR09_3904 [Mucilaginibacter sp.]|nr:hypothetical protein [Mucilaginibacter sp.]
MLLLTYFYINSNFTLPLEDSLYKNISFYAFKLLGSGKHTGQDDIRFINTSHNLALVRDTGRNTGVVAVTDRRKLAAFLEALCQYHIHPKFIVVDLEFYYPFVAENEIQKDRSILSTDKRLQAIISKFGALTSPVAFDENDRIKPPVVSSKQPGIASFSTYSDFLTKFQLSYKNGKFNSIPLIVYQHLSGNIIKHHGFVSISQSKIALNNISPYYYITDDIARETPDFDDIAGTDQTTYSAYNDKIIFIGNFDMDKAQTAIGEMPGTVVLANIYLTLKNGHHLVSIWWFLFMLAVFILLSYLAWFKKMPKVNLHLKIIFSEQIAKFINDYCSYFGVMLLVSVLSFLVFHIFVNILFSSLIFSTIEFFTNKNYRHRHV